MNDATEGAIETGIEIQPTDITLRVLGDLMQETMVLMDETVEIGDARNGAVHSSPHEIAVGLRLAARLARVGGWLMTHSPAEAGLADPDEYKAARMAASLELQAAARGKIDGADRHGPIRHLANRIDRLVARACRLDAQLNPAQSEPKPRTTPPTAGGRVLAFPGAARTETV